MAEWDERQDTQIHPEDNKNLERPTAFDTELTSEENVATSPQPEPATEQTATSPLNHSDQFQTDHLPAGDDADDEPIDPVATKEMSEGLDEQAESAPEDPSSAEKDEPEESFDEDALVLNEYQCTQCGETVLSLPEFPLLGCLFCCSSFENIVPEPALLWAVNDIVPFQVDKGLFFESLLRWMAQGELTPDDIFRQVYLDLAEELYLPFYLFSGEYQATYTAALGTEQTDPITKNVSIEWERVSGEVEGQFSVLQYAGESNLPPEIIEFLEMMPIDGHMIKSFESFTIEGSVFKPFNWDADSLYDMKTSHGLQARIETEAIVHLNTPHVDEVTVSPRIEKTVKSIYLPVWLLSYEYKEELYYAVADGILAKKAKEPRIYGTKPSDTYREMLLESLYFPFKVSVGIATVLMVLVLLLAGLSSWAQLIVLLGYVAFVLGMYRHTEKRRFNIIKESKEKKNLVLRHLHQKAVDILTSTWRADLIASYTTPSVEPLEEGEEGEEHSLPSTTIVAN